MFEFFISKRERIESQWLSKSCWFFF